MKDLLKEILKLLDKNNIDSLIIKHPANVSYLSGFNAREAVILVSHKQSFFITDFRYLGEAKIYLKNKNLKIECVTKNNSLGLVTDLIKKLRLKRIGFEAQKINFVEYKYLLKNSCGFFKIIPTFNLVEILRVKKSECEISKIKTSVLKLVNIFKDIKNILRPQITEIELAAEIEKMIRNISTRPPAFEPIIASGLQSSLPHAISTKNKINKTSPILVDIGLDLSGYKSDLTRVFFLSKISRKISKIYDIVKFAQEKAIENIKPGVSCNYIDRIARNIIENKGFGKFFGHSLGHGIGLEVHENPSINPINTQPLEEGMVITIEPAIYLPGEFGIRLEDMVLVTKTNYEVLSGSLSK
ncbi:MAG: Xaa-Pro peptidase family protein [Candidatus Omnitrophota bacterium]